MSKIIRLLKYFTPVDLVVITSYLLLTLTHLVFHDKIAGWYEFAFYNILAILLIFVIAFFDRNLRHPVWTNLHNWYLILFVLLTFKQIYFMVDPIRGTIIDQLLINWDYAIFGVNPTQWLHQYSFPLLTELLQIVYSTFFFLPVILGYDLLRNNRIEAFNFTAFMIVYGFMLSFIGYFLFPAIGPRFTLHQFEMTNIELPGLFLTNFLREIINTAEGVPSGTINPIQVVQRDVFPSGHTQMTLIAMILAVKYKVKSAKFIVPVGTLLIFSTVYLRYHYVVDVIAGIIFMVFTFATGKYIYKYWKEFRGAEFNTP